MSTWPLLPHRLAVGIGVCVALFFLTSSCANDAVPGKGGPHFTGERAGALEPGTVSTDPVAATAQPTAPLPETGSAAARPAAEETTVEPVPGLDSSPPPSTSAPPIEPAVPEAPAEDPAATSTLASQDVEGPLSSADSDSSVPLIEEPGPEEPQPEEPQPQQPQPEEPQPQHGATRDGATRGPETAQPETAQPETAQPEEPQPETAQPEERRNPRRRNPRRRNPRRRNPRRRNPRRRNPRRRNPRRRNPRRRNPRRRNPRRRNPRRRPMTVCGSSMMPSTRQRWPPRPIRPEWGWWQPPAI